MQLNMRGIDLELNISDFLDRKRLYFNVTELDIKNILKYLISNAAKSSARGSSISLVCIVTEKKETLQSDGSSFFPWKHWPHCGTRIAPPSLLPTQSISSVGLAANNDEEPAQYILKFTVQDTGLGISTVRVGILYETIVGTTDDSKLFCFIKICSIALSPCFCCSRFDILNIYS